MFTMTCAKNSSECKGRWSSCKAGTYITLAMKTDLKYSNGSVATRKFQSTTVPACGEMMKGEWATSSYANKRVFWPMYS